MRFAVLAAALLLFAQAAQAAPHNKQAQAHYARAQAAYDRGDYEEAAREFNAAYALVPRAELLFNLGQTYRALGKLAKARDFWTEYLERAVPHDPYRPTVQKMIAEVSRQIEEEQRKPAPPAEATPPPLVAPPPVEKTPPLAEAAPRGTGLAAARKEPQKPPPLAVAPPPVEKTPPPAEGAARGTGLAAARKEPQKAPPVAPTARAAPSPQPDAGAHGGEQRRGIRRFWWTIPVAAAVAAGIAVALYFALRPAAQVACDGRSLGCVTF
jgi:tetratricopeptide (TPR) repeat protein